MLIEEHLIRAPLGFRPARDCSSLDRLFPHYRLEGFETFDHIGDRVAYIEFVGSSLTGMVVRHDSDRGVFYLLCTDTRVASWTKPTDETADAFIARLERIFNKQE